MADLTPEQIQQAQGIARLVVHADRIVTRTEIVRLARAVLALTEQQPQPHVIAIAPRSDGKWGTYCTACSDEAGDYTQCKASWAGAIPAGLGVSVPAIVAELAEQHPEPVGGSGVELIAAERQRQISAAGHTPQHDAHHPHGELALAAICYAFPPGRDERGDWITDTPSQWPWEPSAWKPSPDDRIKELAKAGALLAAEIDRLSRYTITRKQPEGADHGE